MAAGAAVLMPDAARAAGATLAATETLFGSPVELRAADGEVTAAALAEVLAGLRGMHRRWNAWKPGELAELNRALREGREAVVSAPLRQLLVGARHYEALSAGCFNAGIGGLVGAWGFHADELADGAAPSQAALSAWTAARPGLSRLRIQGRRVTADSPQVQVDFGGYAKGCAVDWALDRLTRRGIDAALVNLGGNLAAMGTVGGRRWRVGLRDPFSSGLVATIETRGREAIVTSGIYERWRVAGGSVTSHVIDPRSGRPAQDLVSVTVVHASAGHADAAATALLVAGPGQWRTLAAAMGVQAVLAIDRNANAFATAAMASRWQDVAAPWHRRLTFV